MVGPRIRRYACVACLAIQVVACRSETVPSRIAQRFALLNGLEHETKGLEETTRAALIGMAYGGLFAADPSSTQVSRVDDHDLELLYRAADLASFYSTKDSYVRAMAAVVDELQRRGLTSAGHYTHLYERYVEARMLADAKAVADKHPLPEHVKLPEIHDATDLGEGQPTVLVVEPRTHTLLRRGVDLQQAAQVVIVSHPGCHFSQAAIGDISADVVLSKGFSEHATWVAPQDSHLGDLDVALFEQWDREHPGHEISVAFKREKWPMIDSWETPTFYFLEKGVVRAKVQGWPKEGHRAELLAGLQKIGLAP